MVSGVEIYLPLAGWWTRTPNAPGWKKNWPKLESQIDRLEELLGSSFAQKAPAAVVEKERQKLPPPGNAAKLREQIGK